jgi:hypothetical protein
VGEVFVRRLRTELQLGKCIVLILNLLMEVGKGGKGLAYIISGLSKTWGNQFTGFTNAHTCLKMQYTITITEHSEAASRSGIQLNCIYKPIRLPGRNLLQPPPPLGKNDAKSIIAMILSNA